MFDHHIPSRAIGAFGSSGVDMAFLLGPSVTSINTVRIAANGGLGAHEAPTWQVFYVLSGIVKVTGDGDTRTLNPGDAVQWEPGELHACRAIVDSLVVLIEATTQVPAGRPGQQRGASLQR